MDFSSSDRASDDALELKAAVAIVCAYIENHAVPAGQIPTLIRGALLGLNARRSIMVDHLVCLACGRSVVLLRRHLRAAHGMTEDDYRARWRLPADFPMVPATYHEHRASEARKIGLGGARRNAGR